MSYQALYRAWRPDTFSQIVGQDAIVRTLRRQVITEQIGHAYLFCGCRGTGKTTAAKVFARAINCLNPQDGDPCGECETCRALKAETCMDVMEIDAASNNSVDEVRELRDRIMYPPSTTKWKVYIIDEVHMLSNAAFNALLKTLEEPPRHAVFILATTDPQKLLPTVLSRCQRYDFHRIGVETIVGRLRIVLDGIGRTADDIALHEIARAAEGAMRDALSLLDVCLSFTDGTVTAELAQDVLGSTGQDFMFRFTDALIDFDAASALRMIAESAERGSDERVFAQNAAAHLRGILLAKLVPDGTAQLLDITEEDAERFREQATRANEAMLTRAMELFMHVEGDLRLNMQPRTVVELAAVRACHPEEEADATVEERMARLEKMLENGVVAAPKKAETAPKATAATAKPASTPQTTVPAEKPTQEYNNAIEKLGERDHAAQTMLKKLSFGGETDGQVTILFDPKRDVMAKGVLQRKEELLNSVFTEAYGRTISVAFRDSTSTQKPKEPGKMTVAQRKDLDQAVELFGRDKIELRD